jgi:hypothetical protein
VLPDDQQAACGNPAEIKSGDARPSQAIDDEGNLGQGMNAIRLGPGRGDRVHGSAQWINGRIAPPQSRSTGMVQSSNQL